MLYINHKLQPIQMSPYEVSSALWPFITRAQNTTEYMRGAVPAEMQYMLNLWDRAYQKDVLGKRKNYSKLRCFINEAPFTIS